MNEILEAVKTQGLATILVILYYFDMRKIIQNNTKSLNELRGKLK